MNNNFLSFFICVSLNFFSFCQNEPEKPENTEPEIYFMKGQDGQHYINNEVYYTMKFLGDEITYMQPGSFKIQDHIITLVEDDYDISLYHNGKSIEDEKKVLQLYKDKQLVPFEEIADGELDVKDEFFVNKEGKLFYLFSINIPTDKVNLDEDYLKKMSILCFIVNNKLSTISFPLFKSESEDEKMTYIKAITESVDIFPSTISIDFLRQRVLNTSDEDLVMNFENAFFKFAVPDYLNVMKSNSKDTWVASFPDVNNVKNAVVVRIIEKEKYKSFKAFNKDVLPQGKIGDDDGKMTLLLKEDLKNVGQINGKSTRFQYAPNGSMRFYHAKKVTFETKKCYGFVFFNATTETYVDNINRFDAFLEGFVITD